MPRGDPVHGVGIVRYPDAVTGQLVPESYRPRSGGRGGLRQPDDSLRQLLGAAYERLPEPLVPRRVERREHLAAVAVEDREPLARRAGLADFPAESVEAANAAGRDAKAGAEAARRGDADPQAGEGARPQPDRDQVDPLPATTCGGGALDLGEQAGRVPGPPLGGEPQLRLVHRLAVTPGADGGVGGGGVEADYEQRRA